MWTYTNRQEALEAARFSPAWADHRVVSVQYGPYTITREEVGA